MRVLVTGADGYLGSLLCPVLDGAGFEVTGLDTGFYRSGWLFNAGGPSPRTITADIRTVGPEVFEGIDAVVHMAELSNDPAGELHRASTMEINHLGSVHLANLAKQASVPTFVYMSSCSVYGVAEGTVDETSAVNPQTTYAECKVLVERDLHAMADDTFSPTFMRNATAFGASPRQRFDLVVNDLCGLAWTTHNIAMTSDGTPWRPLVHGLDIAGAILEVLRAPREAVHDQVFNVGENDHNYQVRQVAEIVAATFPGCALSFGPPSSDNRSYKVNFDKIHAALPGFLGRWSVDDGALQLRRVFEAVGFDDAIFRAPAFTRLRMLKQLLDSAQLDEHFHWTTPSLDLEPSQPT